MFKSKRTINAEIRQVVAVLRRSICFSLVVLVALLSTALLAQDPENLFAERCAVCHLNPDPELNAHTPGLSDMRSFTPNSVYAALTDGLMRMQAKGLQDTQLRALAAWISGSEVSEVALAMTTNLCHDTDDSRRAFSAASGWNGWGPDGRNQRYAAQAGVTAEDLPDLELLWAFGLPGESQPRAQPAVHQGRVYVGNRAGAVYALDADTGCAYWSFLPRAGVRSALSVAALELPDGSQGHAVYFIDMLANVYAVNAASGELLWQHKVDEHPSVRGTGALTVHEGRVYVPITGVNEENTAANPDYACCTFRGSLSALDAVSGEPLWKYYTVAEPQPRGSSSTGVTLFGPAGVGIWSAPTIDARRGLVYVATGNAYAEPVPVTANAVLAVSMDSGELVWARQLTEGDAWISGCPDADNPNCPQETGPDYDFSASPILAESSSGDEVLVIPQKSGLVYGLDPEQSGAVLWQYRVGPGSPVGGVWGAAVAGDTAYVAVGGYFSADSGGIHAIDISSGQQRWYSPPATLLCAPGQGCGPTQSAAVTAIPGAVFSGSQDGGMRAYDAENGEVLWRFDANRSFSTVNQIAANGASFDGAGPVVAEGKVFVLSGNGGFVGRPGNVMLVFAVSTTAE